MKKILALPAELYQNRKLVLSLAKNDFKTKYAGSYLGIVWAFIQPIVTILVYWFVFSVGLKAGTVSDYPFVLYLVSGIVPWFFFQDALNGGTNALLEYNYLVKKVVFKISILPIVKIISALFVHVFFVVFALILCACYGYTPSLYTLQIIYYSVCTFLFVLGLVYATSAIVIFFRDLTQIINIGLQVGAARQRLRICDQFRIRGGRGPVRYIRIKRGKERRCGVVVIVRCLSQGAPCRQNKRQHKTD